MNIELNNMDDLLEDSIGKALRELGYVFPRTLDEFKHIQECVEKKNIAMPSRLQDPYSFLGKKLFSHSAPPLQEQGEYFQQLSQAARDGNVISDDIKKKMENDKKNARKKGSEQ